MHALGIVVVVASIFSAFAWIASLVTRDTSWVDRGWSVVPVVYVALFAADAHWRDARLDVMAALVFAWGIRLTFNFARKGGYSGVEDYRWAVLRSRMSPPVFQAFNLFFIVIYQNLLLVLISLGAYVADEHRGGFGGVDFVLSAIFALALTFETLADQQQWRFHEQKAARRRAGEAGPDFLTTGLFRFSRHPNYFFEIAQWWLVYAFGSVAAGTWWNVGLLGAVLLSLLFVGSTRFTEEISTSKYPDYAQYQRTTSAIVPWFARRVRP